MIDVIFYIEVESRINEEMKVYVSEEFKIINIKVVNYVEIYLFENVDCWFKLKVFLIVFDEESGKECKINMYMLV